MSEFFAYLESLRTDIEPGLTFVAMPFAETMRARYKEVVVPAIEGAGMVPRRADDIYTSQSIMVNVIELLMKAELVVADVTGRNPNVLYELGMANAFGKRTVLISSADTDIPVDLRPFVHVILGDTSQRAQIHAIQKAINDVRSEGHRRTALSHPQRLLNMCDSMGIIDSDEADPNLLFRTMLSARSTLCAVGLTGRSIFSADAANLKGIRARLSNVETEVFLSHPDTDSASYADAIEGTAPGAARMQILLSTARFRSLGMKVGWVRVPISIGGILVDAGHDHAKGMFQFFVPGKWNSQLLTVRKAPEGMYHSLVTLFAMYKATSDIPPSTLG